MSRRWAGYAAYANALMAMAQLLTSGGDTTANGTTGLLNNIAGVLWAISFAPIAYLLYRESRTRASIVSAAAFAFGIVAFAASIFLEVSTAIGRLTFQQETVAYYPVLGAIGVWLVMAEVIALMETDLPRGPLIFGAVTGSLWFLANVLFGAGGLPLPAVTGSMNDATDGGILLLETAFLLQPLWALWMGRSLLPRPVVTPPSR